MDKQMAIQMLTRKPDGNGNVPRLLLVYSPLGNVDNVVTIDYGNIPGAYRDLPRLPDMKLDPAEFRSWVDFQRDRENH